MADKGNGDDNGWRNACCIARKSERSAYNATAKAYRKSQTDNEKDQNINASGTSSLINAEIQTFRIRHKRCARLIDLDPDYESEFKIGCGPEHRLQLALLRTSRQVYCEANHILWSTNTFSFNHAATAKMWLSNRNATQKRSLKKLHFTLPGRDEEESAWKSVFPMKIVKTLVALRLLRLCIEQYALVEEIEDVICRPGTGWKSWTEGILRFQALPLKKVAILFSNPSSNEYRFLSLAKRVEYAQILEKRLLHPNSVEDYQEKRADEMEEATKKRLLMNKEDPAEDDPLDGTKDKLSDNE